MDAQTLMDVMQPSRLKLHEFQRLLPAYENAARAANITTVERAAMFAAQIGHESSGLFHMEEIASGQAYEGRADLGNAQPGDGRRYKGRGPIQLTGRSHYRNFTRWAQNAGHTTIDFEAEPRRLEEPRWGFLAATYYWTVSRPRLNEYADKRDLFSASCEINGWIKQRDGTWRTPNGYADRKGRYERALAMGARLLTGGINVAEKVLDYSRDQVTQDTFYNCGPASVQTIIQARTGKYVSESELGRELGTHRGGTDYIGSFPAVLNRHIGGDYAHRDVPAYLDDAGKDVFWSHIVESINSGFGVVVNIVAPPSNYPRAVAPSTISPAYSGGTVYHYVAVMGYSDAGRRKVWVADSGFSPYGYWLSFDQLCTLVVPKGYAYSTIKTESSGGDEMAADLDTIITATDGSKHKARDLIAWTDGRVFEMHSQTLPRLEEKLDAILEKLGE